MEEKNTKLKLANRALNFENSGIKDWKQAHVYGSCEIKESDLKLKTRNIILADN